MNRMRIRRVGGWLVLGLLAAWGCGGDRGAPYVVLKPRDIQYSILATFTVDSPKPLTLQAADGGTVASIAVTDGETVKEGQLLVQLEDFTARQNVRISASALEASKLKLTNATREVRPRLEEQRSERQAALESARADFERSKQLLEIGAIAAQELEQARDKYQKALSDYNQTQLTLKSFSVSGAEAAARAEVEENTARLALAQKALDDKRITAPFNATISDIQVQAGQMLQPHSPVVVIVEDQVPTLELDIDQKELPYLKDSLKAVVRFDAYPDNPVPAKVAYVCTDINTDKGTCTVRLLLDQTADFVKYGMTGTAEIEAGTYTQVLAVPAKYIERTPEGAFAWRWDGNQAIREKVQTQRIGERWEILSGLPEGTELLLPSKGVPPARLKPGTEEEPGA